MRKKLLVILLCCLGACALALGSAVWWTSRYMRSPEFRTEFTRLMRESSGHEVSIAGELEVSVFPWFGLSAKGIELGNEPDFGPKPLLTARALVARIKVLPLFQRRLVFDTVDLEEADLALTLDAGGRGNWDHLLERIRAQENATGTGDAFFRTMTVRGVRISDGKARLDDLKHNHAYIMTAVDLRTGRIESGKPLSFTLACDFTWLRPGLTSHLEAAGKLNWSGDASLPLFTETTAQGEIGGTFMPRGAPRAALTAALSMEDGNKNLRLSNLKLKVLGVELSGDVTFFDVTELFRMQAHLDVARFNPRSVINAYWPGAVAVEHPNALHTAEGPLELSANEDELVFTSPGLAVDGSRLRGRVRMGFGETPGLDFDLAADHLDADAYATAFSANATGAPLVVDDLPLAYLRSVKGQGRLQAETLKIAGVPTQGAELSWTGAGGLHRAQMKPAKAQGGSVAADISVSFAGGQPDKNGQPGPAVLGFAGNLRLDGVDARQVSWVNRPGFTTSGRLDLNARAEAVKAPAAGSARLGVVLRRAVVDISAGIGPATLEWEADKSQPKAQPRRMLFSSVQAQARLLPVAAPGADWSVQADGSLTAVGIKPQLNLEAKGAGLLRAGQSGGAVLTSAQVSGKLKGWFLPKRENEASFSGKGGLDFQTQSLNLNALSVQACGLNLSGGLSGAQVLGNNFSLSGRIRCQEGDPKRVLAALETRVPKTSDRRALSRFSGEADVSVNAKGVQLSNITAQLDDTPVQGIFGLQGFENPRQTFGLQVGGLDLDRYLPAPVPTPPRHSAQVERLVPEPLPVETVRELSAEGSLAFRSLKLHGLTTRGLKLGVLARDGTLTIKPISGNFYEGELSGEFTAQAVPGGLQTRLSLAAKNFQAGPFMIGWVGKEYVSGKTEMFLDVGGVGATDLDLLRSLEGMAEFHIADGSYMLSGSAEPQAQPRRPGATPQPAPASQFKRTGTPFHQAGARFKVQKGVFASDDFRLDGPNISVTGRGRFSVAEDTINMGLTANMPGVPDVPIRVFGRLKDPEMEIPAVAFINNTIKEILGLPLKPIKFFKDLLF